MVLASAGLARIKVTITGTGARHRTTVERKSRTHKLSIEVGSTSAASTGNCVQRGRMEWI
ncbi:hypothetical protein Tamer19_22220 [Cupriavidus sp. TA19]|nr:hypothetical protein Tamer19_22220 [Cupriavidus sp. TA19]